MQVAHRIGPLAASVVIAVGVAAYSMTQDPLEIAGSTADGRRQRDARRWAATCRTANGTSTGARPSASAIRRSTRSTPENVGTLKVAWHYQTGDVKLPDDVGETTYQVTPLKIGDTLYLCTPHNLAIALDAGDRPGELAVRSECPA